MSSVIHDLDSVEHLYSLLSICWWWQCWLNFVENLVGKVKIRNSHILIRRGTQFPTEKSENNEPSVNRFYVATVRSCHAPPCPMERDLHRPLAAIPMALTSLTPSMRSIQRIGSKPRRNPIRQSQANQRWSIRQSQENHRWPDERKMTMHTSRLATRPRGKDTSPSDTMSMTTASNSRHSGKKCGKMRWMFSLLSGTCTTTTRTEA